MSNNIDALNDHLFNQLTRLNSGITGDELKTEIERSKAVTQIASEIFKGAKLQLDAASIVAKGAVAKNDITMFTNRQIENHES